MNKPSTRNVLLAFIASPSDLADERKAAKEVVLDLNAAFRSIDWQIDLLGWEDTMPGASRPQELINKDVDACELFIGALWKRWGQSTGNFSSGFEEEFQRAVNRKNETTTPEIWLFFKRVEPDLISDPGPQLTRVLEFKKREIEFKRVLFNDFDDLEEWKSRLRIWLSQLILQRDKQFRQLPEKTVASPPLAETVSEETSSSTQLGEKRDEAPAHKQLTELFNSIEETLRTHNSVSSVLDTDDLSSFQVARHHLFSSTLMSARTTETLGVHDTHLLYQEREKVQADPRELMMIFRTLLADEKNLLVGWYWLSWIGVEQLRQGLLECATKDRNFMVRLRAWEVLRTLATPMPEDPEWRDYILRVIVSDESSPVRRAGVAYLGAIASEEDLLTIERTVTDDRDGIVRREAFVSRLLVLARTRPDEILTETLPDLHSEKKRVISELQSNANHINEESLIKALKSPDEDIRFFALGELKLRNALSVGAASSLLKDPSAKVSEFIYRYLIAQGEKVDPLDILQNVSDETYKKRFERNSLLGDSSFVDPEAIVLEIFKSYSQDALWKLVEWESQLGPIAYKALALYHFPGAATRIRTDLSEEFRDAEQQFLEVTTVKWREIYDRPDTAFWFGRRPGISMLRSALGVQHSEEQNTPEASAKREAGTVKAKYITAALAGILINGERDDVRFGEKYLAHDEYDVRLDAVRVIERFGGEHNVPSLLDLAKNSEGELQEKAALASLRRSTDTRETARTLIFSTKEVLVSISMGYLLNELDVTRTALFLEPLLLEKSDIIRKKTTAFFARKLSTEELEQLLVRYTSHVTYYYDVVCWLDRILFAPESLKEAFVQELRAELA